jgi:hypothetical protein
MHLISETRFLIQLLPLTYFQMDTKIIYGSLVVPKILHTFIIQGTQFDFQGTQSVLGNLVF